MIPIEWPNHAESISYLLNTMDVRNRGKRNNGTETESFSHIHVGAGCKPQPKTQPICKISALGAFFSVELPPKPAFQTLQKKAEKLRMVREIPPNLSVTISFAPACEGCFENTLEQHRAEYCGIIVVE